MGKFQPGPREERLRDFHSALFLYLFDNGRAGQIISNQDWTKLIVQGLGVMSRPGVHDITFVMENLGMIQLVQPTKLSGKQGRPGREVVVLPPPTPAPGQSLPGIAPVASAPVAS